MGAYRAIVKATGPEFLTIEIPRLAPSYTIANVAYVGLQPAVNDSIIVVFEEGRTERPLAITGTSALDIETSNAAIKITNTAATESPWRMRVGDAGGAAADLIFERSTDSGATWLRSFEMEENGDIRFFNADGTTTTMYWDASADRLGIGTESPATSFHISTATPTIALTDTDTGHDSQITTNSSTGSLALKADVNNEAAGSGVLFEIDGSEVARFTDAGSLGIGGTTANNPLHITTAHRLGTTFTGGVAGEGLRVTPSSYVSGNYVSLVEGTTGSSVGPHVRIAGYYDSSGSHLAFGTSNNYSTGITNQAMTIYENGNVEISTVLETDSIDCRTHQQLLLHAGESLGKPLTAQTGERVYLNAEAGIRITTPSVSNWGVGYADRITDITGTDITVNGATVWDSVGLAGLGISGGNTPPSGSQIIKSHTNGYLYTGWINTVSGSTATTPTRIYASNDSFLRYMTPANFRTQVTEPYYLRSDATDTCSGAITFTADQEINDSNFHIKSDASGSSTLPRGGTATGLLLTAAGMNTTSKFTPGIMFGSTDPNFTTTNPKVLAGIWGVATETYSTDTDSGMYMFMPVAPINNGTGHGVSENSVRGLIVGADAVRPIGDNNTDLGLGSNAWKDLYYDGTANPSDERDKDNITDLDLGLGFIQNLRPVTFNWNRRNGESDDVVHMGVVAQEVKAALDSEGVVGDWAIWREFLADESPEHQHDRLAYDKQFVSYQEMIPAVIKAVQELSEKIEELEAKLQALTQER